MVAFLRERDRGLFATDTDLQPRTARIDREVLVAQASHQVEGLPRRLLPRHAKRVGRHRGLDRGAHLRRGTEEAIGGCQAFKCLVRALEVVVLHEERRAPEAIVEVGEHRAREELLPHRLPEALDLAAGLRVVRAALHVRDAVTPERLLELGRTAPCSVLPPLIGQDLARGSVVGDRPLESLHHERALLVVRHHQAHQVARVIVHEGGHVHALVAAQEEGEEVRLPQLVGLGTFESVRLSPGLGPGRLALLGEPLALQHPPYRRLRGADAEETLHHVADAPASCLWLRLLGLHDGHPARIELAHQGAAPYRSRTYTRLQRLLATRPVLLRPLRQGRLRNPELTGNLCRRQLLLHHHGGGRLHHVQRPSSQRLTCVFAIPPFTSRLSVHPVHSFSGTVSIPIGGRVLGHLPLKGPRT